MSLRNRANSFRYAFQGLADLFRSQPNARIHLLFALLALVAGWALHITRPEWLAIIICITLVLVLEALNTALEYFTDLVQPDYHPLAGKIKDVAAAAVLLGALGAATVGVVIFLPRLLTLFG